MMTTEFFKILIACALTGVAFAVIAWRITLTTGNRLNEAIDAAKTNAQPGTAFDLNVLDKVKFRSTSPIVALFAVFFLCASGTGPGPRRS